MKSLPLLLAGLLVAVGLAYLLSGSSDRNSEAARLVVERAAAPTPPDRVRIPTRPEPVEREPEPSPHATELEADSAVGGEEASADEPAPSVPASLRITVVDRASGRAVSGARLVCRMAGRDPYMPLEYIEYFSGDTSQAILTDERGEGIFQLVSGKRLSLDVWSQDGSPGRITRELRALEADELRDVEIEVTLDGDVAFYGAVLSPGGKPVSTAEIFEVQAGRVASAMQPDEMGCFSLHTDSWRRSYLHVKAPGFAPRFVPLTPPYGTERIPRAIFLEPQAALVLRVQFPSGAWASNVGVRLSCRPEDVLPEDIGLEKKAVRKNEARRLIWTGQTDHDGFARIEGLPVGTPLKLVLEEPKEEQDHGTLNLQPGENEHQVTLRGMGVLRGRLLDGEGDPIAFKELWLHRGSRDKPLYFTCAKFYDGAASTDADGWFEVPGLKEGPLLIGPTPACPKVPMKRERTYNVPKVAPLALSIAFGPESDEELVIRLDRERYIEGKVLRGNSPYPQPDLEVQPLEQEGTPPWFSSGDGTFRIGPLQSGAYRIRAHSRGDEFLSTDWAQRRAADLDADDAPEPLVLNLEPKVGRIAGRVLGPDGMPASCFVFLDMPESQDGFNEGITLSDLRHTESDPSSGEWSFLEVEPGVHRIQASSVYGMGHAQVLLTSERSETLGVTIHLEEWAVLDVQLLVRVSTWNAARASRKGWRLRGVSQGEVVFETTLQGFQTSLPVPQGPLELTLFSPDGTTAKRKVEAVKGKTVSVKFGPLSRPQR